MTYKLYGVNSNGELILLWIGLSSEQLKTTYGLDPNEMDRQIAEQDFAIGYWGGRRLYVLSSGVSPDRVRELIGSPVA